VCRLHAGIAADPSLCASHAQTRGTDSPPVRDASEAKAYLCDNIDKTNWNCSFLMKETLKHGKLLKLVA